MAKKQRIIEKYNINGIFARNLSKIEDFKIVCICDDSTSMRETLNNGKTKWDELKQGMETVLEIANAFDVDCDVLFLNRANICHVKEFGDLSEQFSTPPDVANGGKCSIISFNKFNISFVSRQATC